MPAPYDTDAYRRRIEQLVKFVGTADYERLRERLRERLQGQVNG